MEAFILVHLLGAEVAILASGLLGVGISIFASSPINRPLLRKIGVSLEKSLGLQALVQVVVAVGS